MVYQNSATSACIRWRPHAPSSNSYINWQCVQNVQGISCASLWGTWWATINSVHGLLILWAQHYTGDSREGGRALRVSPCSVDGDGDRWRAHSAKGNVECLGSPCHVKEELHWNRVQYREVELTSAEWSYEYHKGMPVVTVVVYGRWSKHSHQHSYNVKFGVGIAMGKKGKTSPYQCPQHLLHHMYLGNSTRLALACLLQELEWVLVTSRYQHHCGGLQEGRGHLWCAIYLVGDVPSPLWSVALYNECTKNSLVLLDLLWKKHAAKKPVSMRHFVHGKRISSLVFFTVLAINLAVALISVPQLGPKYSLWVESPHSLMRSFSLEQSHLIPFPGDWHILFSSQKALNEPYADTDLASLAKVARWQEKCIYTHLREEG